MKTKLELTDYTGVKITLDWDTETGTLAGPQSDPIKLVLRNIQQRGYVIADPMPTRYEITDPLRNPGELAASLNYMGYRLPSELASALPAIPNDLPADAVP